MKSKTLFVLIFMALVMFAACKSKPDEVADGDEPATVPADVDAGEAAGKSGEAPGKSKPDKAKKKADPDMGPAVDAGQ